MPLSAENLTIEAKNISLDKNREISIFRENVKIVTDEGNILKSEYVEYDKKKGLLKLKDNISVIDTRGNKINTNFAEYNEKNKVFNSFGETIIETSENYLIKGNDIKLDNINEIINSEKQTTIEDNEGNLINLENFEYNAKKSIFKSLGFTQIKDKNNNDYNFSQIYIDTKKKEILGTDSKVFLNQDNFKINKKNKPRVFSNSVNIKADGSSFTKSIFTFCDYRKNDKCPPWSIQSSKMLHDNKKKTIYYDNALIKVYDIPIFYLPKLSHPDPTVERRSGFLTPSLLNSTNLGSGFAVPYFFNLGVDKNFTLSSRFYPSEHPLFLGEYHQEFKNSTLITDFGYTEGYKKTSTNKKAGEKSHFFSKFVKNFEGRNGSNNSFTFEVQDVSNDKYLKLYKIDSELVDYNKSFLENSISFTHEDDGVFFGLNANIFETLNESYNDKYEYILPEITYDKNLFSNYKFGKLDLQSNFKVHNFDTNKLTSFNVNDLNWSFRDINFNNGIKSKIFSEIKNINYEAKNVDIYKDEPTNELFGAVGVLSKINFQKINQLSSHFLTPKALIRYAPGNMRKETSGSRLNSSKAFTVNRVDNNNNFETGLSATLGVDYKLNANNKVFDFSVAQIINEKENKKMSSESSLDEKLSDLVGAANLKINENINLNYNFSVDQNYSDLNYNEVESSFDFDPIKVNFSYLQEKKHIGNQEYFKTKINLKNNENSNVIFETKRNLISSSAEYYNLSYEYINDCLRAGLVYRREFYNDSELEPENSLMFKITLVPFGDINSPSFNQ